jgi:hypothetical protein
MAQPGDNHSLLELSTPGAARHSQPERSAGLMSAAKFQAAVVEKQVLGGCALSRRRKRNAR